MTEITKGSMHLSGSRHKRGNSVFHTLLIYDDKAKRDEVVAEVYFCERTGLGLADGHRLVACWNALAGIADPAAYVATTTDMQARLDAAEARVAEIRNEVAKLYVASGCSCCRDDDAWDAASMALGRLLGAPDYADGSGVDWFAVRDAALATAQGETP